MPEAVAGTRGTRDTAFDLKLLAISHVARSEFRFSFVNVIVSQNCLVFLIYGVRVGTRGRKSETAVEPGSFENKPAMCRVPSAATSLVGRVSS